MNAPLTFETLGRIASLPDDALHLAEGPQRMLQARLYAALRREQVLGATVSVDRPESARVLDFARAAFRELEVVLAGLPNDLLDGARDGSWKLRDLLRHAIAVELRYPVHIRYACDRADDQPVRIPDERMPCDVHNPTEPEFADSRTGDLPRLVELLGIARAQADATLSALTSDRLDRPTIWGTAEITARERLHQLPAHLVEVAIQATKMLGAAGVTTGEARSILRRVRGVRGAHEAATDAAQRAELDSRLAGLAPSA